ncbi:hypothetical protein [Nocardia sp. NPDC050710]|uniref:hypothetical protein n=1 Tax=Nocardia sp. NPDC050710 TaxID=3157220 RepID=UPI003403E1E8
MRQERSKLTLESGILTSGPFLLVLLLFVGIAILTLVVCQIVVLFGGGYSYPPTTTPDPPAVTTTIRQPGPCEPFCYWRTDAPAAAEAR